MTRWAMVGPSFRRKPESRLGWRRWAPACAGTMHLRKPTPIAAESLT